MSISIVLLAGILLTFRVLSDILIAYVIRRQWKLLRLPIPDEYKDDERSVKKFRKILFFLSIAIFVGNFIPIIIDSLTLFVETGRPAQVKTISVAYAFSNATTALISATLIWLLYFAGYNARDAKK